MLNQKEETFLLKLRMTLLERGKDEASIDEIEEELRDHFHEAHANGHSTSNITDHSVEAYINNISQEVPYDQKWLRFLIKTVAIIFILTLLPKFFNGTFALTIGLLIYLTTVLLIGFIAWKFIKMIVIKWGYDILAADKTPIKLYVACFCFAIIIMGLFVANVYFTSHYPIYTFMTFSSRTNVIIGCVISVIILFVTGLKKSWILLMTTLVITLPSLITLALFGNLQSQQAATTDAIIFIVLLVVFNVISFIVFRKADQETD